MSQFVGRDFFTRGLKVFELTPVAKNILKPIIAGDDKAEDFEEAIKSNPNLSRQIILTANQQLKKGYVDSLAHAVVLIGKNTVRDYVLSRSILQMTQQNQEEKIEKIEVQSNVFKYAETAEIIVKDLGAEFSGGAWAIGFLYDFIENWMNNHKLSHRYLGFFEKTWEHSLRTAVMAWSFAKLSKLSDSACKHAYFSGLTHDIGKLILCVVYPDAYGKVLSELAQVKALGITDDDHEAPIELKHIGISHPEASSLLLTLTEYLIELEEIVDFHHNLEFVKSRNPQILELAKCLRLADCIANSLENQAVFDQDVLSHILKRLDYTQGLSPQQILDQVSALKSKGLLS